MKITIKTLRNACSDAREAFEAAFPNSASIEETIEWVSSHIYWLVWGLGSMPIKIVREAIRLGADVNAKDKFGSTPLHYAALIGQARTVELLISKGADVNAKDDYDWTPLHRAALNGETETVELLILNGSDVNAKNNNGWTPLDYAGENGRNKIAELLRKQGDSNDN